MKIYICGIHTDVGKTYFSAAFCEAFRYDYFKLVQAGIPKDSEFIASLSPKTFLFEEGIFLQTAASPHIGKKNEKLDYEAFDIRLPSSKNVLIETAGGLFTPIDEKTTMIDYISQFKHPCILVAKYYLGAINHILLSLQALKLRKIPLMALVMMGEKNEPFDEFILSYTQISLFHLPFYTANNFTTLSRQIKKELQNLVEKFERSDTTN
ncbi:ATP-dependent dethiobiotin synthetase BioD [Campylobacter sp. MIT 21-1685]|uniref:dethiobiotin synthase n=1 Tax=unclassified Campylobacter TaxID=2593542 RepID=UPI00224B8836|nr:MULTISPECIES: ATP-dependent dethiobiotin synthetase BioD [unclassified Campylobacter]MCX2683041.1 ATP-dependent dethiobiotin synthetase BioD [Campylobacter sp. MIT 21-1684]MCX2751323.1 ATP-dependent dethiobiotin synthetase BioD [Campylobacter sp. MIT 21-1682]MCX2807522.1 ATP-dependent dethiobiotin synthetase BioD [Campylobacter sp. MIT 21-1685]